MGRYLTLLVVLLLASVRAEARDYLSTILADTPSVYYRMNDPSGTTMVDWAGAGGLGVGNGTYTGSPTLAHVTAPVDELGVRFPDSAKKATSHAFGTNDCTQFYDPPGSAAVTWEAWINSEHAGTDQVAMYGTSTSQCGSFLGVNTTGPRMIEYTASCGIAMDSGAGSAGSVVLGQWYHIAGVANRSGTPIVKAYLNGVLFNSSTTQSQGPSWCGHGQFTVAQRVDGGSPFTGTISDIAVYNKELTANQLLAHYRAGVPGHTGQSGSQVKNTVSPDDNIVGWFLLAGVN